MWRSILAILAGIVVGGFLAFLVEIPGMLIHPLPPGADIRNPDVLKSHMASAPQAAHVLLAVAWTLAPLAGSWLAATIARKMKLVHAIVVGMFFLAMDMMNVRNLPHPMWLNVVAVVAPIAACWLGGLLAEKTSRRMGGPQRYDMREKNMAC
jgi:hypothetical protein